MTKAPEKIWHFFEDAAQYESISFTPLPDHTAYTRTDLADTAYERGRRDMARELYGLWIVRDLDTKDFTPNEKELKL